MELLCILFTILFITLFVIFAIIYFIIAGVLAIAGKEVCLSDYFWPILAITLLVLVLPSLINYKRGGNDVTGFWSV